jgi:WD40 repeat protein
METQKLIADFRAESDHPYRLAYSRDGRLLAASTGKSARIWDVQTHEQLGVLPHIGRVYGLAFNADGSRLATACQDSVVHLWDVKTAQEVAELRGHESYVHAVDFSRDGTRLLSASGDFTVRLWDTLSPAERHARGGLADVAPK